MSRIRSLARGRLSSSWTCQPTPLRLNKSITRYSYGVEASYSPRSADAARLGSAPDDPLQPNSRPPAVHRRAAGVHRLTSPFAQQCDPVRARWETLHLTSPSPSAWNFFCRISNAAASANAFPKRRLLFLCGTTRASTAPADGGHTDANWIQFDISVNQHGFAWPLLRWACRRRSTTQPVKQTSDSNTVQSPHSRPLNRSPNP